ncbi:hypothetical protein AAG906_005977 [Vitis piasezkii]
MPAILGFTSPFFPTIETLSTIMLRDFLWGGGNLERKPHLVRWELVCLSKRKGFGVKCLSTFNKALLCKWNWRFANERGFSVDEKAWLVDIWDSSTEGVGDGTLASLDPLMIGRWRRRKAS